MNKERLLRLAEHLDTVPNKKYSHFEWFCGTKACALGHATNVLEFNLDGLFRSGNYVAYRTPSGVEYGIWAAQSFFDLSSDICDRIFSTTGYSLVDGPVTPRAVAVLIRKVVAGG